MTGNITWGFVLKWNRLYNKKHYNKQESFKNHRIQNYITIYSVLDKILFHKHKIS